MSEEPVTAAVDVDAENRKRFLRFDPYAGMPKAVADGPFPRGEPTRVMDVLMFDPVAFVKARLFPDIEEWQEAALRSAAKIKLAANED